MVRKFVNIFTNLLNSPSKKQAPSWILKQGATTRVPGYLPLNDHIRCDLLDACFNGTHIWVSHRLKTVYFETPKAASSTMRSLLETSNPKLWFYADDMVGLANMLSDRTFQLSSESVYESGKYRTALMNIITDIINVDQMCGLTKPVSTIIDMAVEELIQVFQRDYCKPNYRERKCATKYGFQMYYGTPLEASKQFSDYYKFSIVRNPYEKMISNYFMFCKKSLVRKNQIELLFEKFAGSINFKEFISLSLIYSNHHWEQHSRYLPIENQRLLLDDVLHVEHLSNDWKNLKRKTGIKDDIVHLNKTAHKKYIKYYDSESKRLVENAFRQDIEFFGYYF